MEEVQMKSPQRILFMIHLSVLMLISAFSGSAFAETALVSAERSGTLTIVDLDTDRVLKTITVGKVPHAIGVTPDKTHAYTGNRGSDSVSVVDLAGDDPVITIPLSHTIMNLEVSPDGRFVAANSRTEPRVSLIETATNTVRWSILVGETPDEPTAARQDAVNMGNPDIHARKGGIAISHDTWSPDSTYLYTPDRVNYRILKIDPAKGLIVARLQMDTPTHHLIVTKDGKTIYAVNDGIPETGLDPSITVINAETMQMVKDIPLPLAEGEFIQGHHATFDNTGRYLYFCNRGGPKGGKRGYTVGVIDTETMTLVKTFRAGFGAGHANFTPDGKYVFILNHFENKVSVMDSATMEPVADIDLPFPAPGSWGHSGCFSADGAYYYQLSEAEGVMVKVDARNLRFVKAIKVGDWPSIMTILR
jgi:YVTN family beta-propeller protein